MTTFFRLAIQAKVHRRDSKAPRVAAPPSTSAPLPSRPLIEDYKRPLPPPCLPPLPPLSVSPGPSSLDLRLEAMFAAGLPHALTAPPLLPIPLPIELLEPQVPPPLSPLPATPESKNLLTS